MSTVKGVEPQSLIVAVAEGLKKMEAIKPHPNSGFVKAGAYAERPPQQPDFWYFRSAAILRRIYLTGPVGTQRLRTAFGGKRRRGHKPAHHRKAGGKFIRAMLQQLEKAGLIKQVDKPAKGRMITPKGQQFLDKIATKLSKNP